VDAALDPTGDGHYKAEYRVISRSDQSVRWVRADGDVTFAGGKAVRLVGTVHDITASRQAQDRLRESEERFKTAVDAADLGVWELDLTTDAMLQRSLRHDEMFGYRELQPEWSSAIAERHMVEEDRPVFREAMARAVETGALSFEARVRWSDGSIHWIAPRGRTHYDESGVATRMTGVVADITERKRHEEQVQFLLRELDHRSKNLLGLVQAVARQTAQGNPEDFLERFGQRIRALSASQDLLLKSEWKGVSLAELARSQLAHFQDLIDRRIVLRGPLLKTTPQAAQTLAMALHELATNAGKYGALSSETGSVEICWELRVAPGRGERFICVWSERDGPAVAAPTRRGFGSTVLERMARVALGAEVKLDFAEAGLVWRLDCPSDRVLESAAPPQQLSGGVAAMSG
jgi:PAS domain S-box-containing protein